MTRHARALLLALALPLAAPTSAPAAADQPVSPSEFRSYAEGYTLYFSEDGKPFGSEAFKPGGETVWRYGNGSCLRGLWRPHGAQLCFYYGIDYDVLCWRILRDEQGLKVRLLGDGPDAGLELRITGRDHEPPVCGGPSRGI